MRRFRAAWLIAVIALLLGLQGVESARPASAVPNDDGTLLAANATPATVDSGVTTANEVGTYFYARRPGQIVGLRFYKAAANTGTHVGNLWYAAQSAGATPIATVTFSGETASGWQTAFFSSPVSVVPGDQLAISYSTNGHFSADANYWASWTPNNFFYETDYNHMGGYYAAPGNPPNQLTNATNYYVDPIMAPTPSPACPCSVLGTGFTPANIDSNDSSAYELGMKFMSFDSGYVTGVRFYKAATNTGTHTGRLWRADGTLLSTVTFTGETASGWQQANFASPIYIAAFNDFMISYSVPNGHYSYDGNYFSGQPIRFRFAPTADPVTSIRLQEPCQVQVSAAITIRLMSYSALHKVRQPFPALSIQS